MKVLMISEKDAANASLAKICESYIKHGHSVVVYAPYISQNVLRFFGETVEIYPLNQLTKEEIERCDIIFCTTMASAFIQNGIILSAHKPIFSHTYLINKQVQWGGDLCFVPSLPTTVSDFDDYVKYPKMAIGEPKYDKVNKKNVDLKRLLLIDSGHYPFGITGKRELVKTILEICRAFPDYELWIKPRFLPTDTVVTHRNSMHLYEVIREEAGNEMPSNLVMLTEHRDLMELIEESCTVLCMHTTAFVGAYAAGKGLVVIDNLPSDDIYDVRWKISERIRDHMKESGAITDYHDVCNVLPKGVECSEEYFRYLLEERENVADKICEVTEYLYDEFYSQNDFPEYKNGAYKEYREIKQACDMTWNKVIKERYISYLASRMLILIDFHIKAKLDVRIIEKQINELQAVDVISDEVFKAVINKIPVIRDECIVDNEERMLEDEIDCGILLNSYYQLKKYDKIKCFAKVDIGAYHLFRAFVAYEEEDFSIALKELKQYMQISLNRTYIKEISDMSNNKMKAFYILINLLIRDEKQEDAEIYLLKMKEYFDSLYPQRSNSDRLQEQQYTCWYWLNGKVKQKKLLPGIDADEKILVYGAGIITKKMLLKDRKFSSRVVALIDRNSRMSEYGNLKVIRPEEISEFKEVRTIVVAVPQEIDSIKNTLKEIRSDIEVISVTEIYD